MLIISEEDDLRPLSGRENRKCLKCGERATWIGATKDEEVDVPMCGWCVLYGGSKWGHENRDEVLLMGIQIRQRALASKNPKTHVPELDERHRLSHEDGERLMLGVGYTSAHLRDGLVGMLARHG